MSAVLKAYRFWRVTKDLEVKAQAQRAALVGFLPPCVEAFVPIASMPVVANQLGPIEEEIAEVWKVCQSIQTLEQDEMLQEVRVFTTEKTRLREVARLEEGRGGSLFPVDDVASAEMRRLRDQNKEMQAKLEAMGSSVVPFDGSKGEAEEKVPDGWEKVPSKSRPGQFAYINSATGERVANLAQIKTLTKEAPLQAATAASETAADLRQGIQRHATLDKIPDKSREKYWFPFSFRCPAKAAKNSDFMASRTELRHRMKVLGKGEMVAAYAVVKKAVASRVAAKGVLMECDAAAAFMDKACSGVFADTWSLIEHTESSGILAYEGAASTLLDRISKRVCVQRRDDLAQLYLDAMCLRDQFVKTLEQVANDAISELFAPSKLKSVQRCMEEVALRPKRNQRSSSGSGLADGVRGVCNLVHATVICPNMWRAADVIKSLTLKDSVGTIVVTQVHERFVLNSTSTGYKDAIIYFYFAKDHYKHICEVTVTHRLLTDLVANANNADESILTRRRSGASGRLPSRQLSQGQSGGVDFETRPHEGAISQLYRRTRNAAELLRKLDMDRNRSTEVARLISEGVSIAHLAHIGCTAKDFLDAGVSATDLKEAGVEEPVAVAVKRNVKPKRRNSLFRMMSNAGEKASAAVQPAEQPTTSLAPPDTD